MRRRPGLRPAPWIAAGPALVRPMPPHLSAKRMVGGPAPAAVAAPPRAPGEPAEAEAEAKAPAPGRPRERGLPGGRESTIIPAR